MSSFEIFERSSMVECDEIEPKLYLGNLDAAESGETLKCFGITHVLTIYMFPITVPDGVDIETLFIDIEDSADCDILSSFEKSNAFIKEGQEKGACLVHCYGGVSRSATLVVAYLMKKYQIGVEEALRNVKDKRYCACPNAGFLSQLRLYESMKYTLDEGNIDYKIFCLYHLGRQVSSEALNEGVSLRHTHTCLRKMPDTMFAVTKVRVTRGNSRSLCFWGNNFNAIQNYLRKFQGKTFDGDKFKCRKCRKCLFTQKNVVPHIQGQDLYWNNFAQQVTSEQSKTLCKNSLFIEFLPWISESHTSLTGNIHCPECSTEIGSFCWKGQLCFCGATISPSFKMNESKLDREFSHVPNVINDLITHHVT